MFVPVVYIAYKEYERQEREKAFYKSQGVRTNREKRQGGEEIGGQSDYLQRDLQRRPPYQRQRGIRRQRKHLETRKKRKAHKKSCETPKEKTLWALLGGKIPTKPIREAASVSVPFDQFSLSHLVMCGSQEIDILFQQTDENSSSPSTNDGAMTSETDNNSVYDPLQNKIVSEPLQDAFRDDVRAEWIRAVFGKDFPYRKEIETNADVTTTSIDPDQTQKKNHNSWKGVGLAGLSSYVSYTAVLDLSQSSTKLNGRNDSDASKPASMDDRNDDVSLLPAIPSESQPQQPPQPSLGMTLSRLSLGLYVRTIRPGSEAWCAGIEENSVLVGINDGELNLLAEPSKLALERIWQYEGIACKTNNSTGTIDEHVEQIGSKNDSEARSRTASAISPNSKMKISSPISLTFIRNGRLYKVILLSDPPYGIDWGPCGKFCLVQRVKPNGIADRAGVRPSSIVAGINLGRFREDSVKNEDRPEDEDVCSNMSTIYHLDHSSVAAALKEATSDCIRQQRGESKSTHRIRIQLCFTPSRARSGHWERQQDALEEKGSKRSNTTGPGGSTNGISINSSTLTRHPQQPTRPRVAAEMNGVQVRIHPLLGPGGGFVGSSRRSIQAGDFDSLRRRSQSASIVSPSSLLSKLAERVAAGEPLSIWGNDNRTDHYVINENNASSSLGEYGNFYRPCPLLKHSVKSNGNNTQPNSNQQPPLSFFPTCPSIFDCWNVQQAFIYVFRYHIARYNEVELKMNASGDNNFLNILRDLLLKAETNNSRSKDREASVILDALSTYLLFWFGWLTANENKPLELTQFLLKLVHQNQMKNNNGSISIPNSFGTTNIALSSFSLAHHMEFLARSLDNGYIKNSLRKLRKERQQQQHLVRNTIQKLDHTYGSNGLPSIRAVTGTTPSHEESQQAMDLTFDRASEQKVPSSSAKAKSTTVEKPKPRRRFPFFRKKKKGHAKNKQSSSTNVSNDSENADVASREKQRPVKEKRNLTDGDRMTSSSVSPPLLCGDLINGSKGSNSCDTKSPFMILKELGNVSLSESADSLFANTVKFLDELETVCTDVEKSLMKSFSQKFARWALQPWTANNQSALTQVTNAMRKRLDKYNTEYYSMPLLDPIDSSSQPLISIDTKGCYILPSAHFPLLLTFDCKRRIEEDRSNTGGGRDPKLPSRMSIPNLIGEEKIYRTSVELVALRGSKALSGNEKLPYHGFTAHGSIAGSVIESQQSVRVDHKSNHHVWNLANLMVFDTRSTWGPPKTFSLRLSETLINEKEKGAQNPTNSTTDRTSRQQECGYCWINLVPFWEETSGKQQVSCKTRVVPPDFFNDFDEHGELRKDSYAELMQCMEIEFRISTKVLETKSSVKRSLLYKHDDDVRQEMFAIEFIKSCDRILQSCGLHLKMLTFRAIPVSKRRGFIEWVPGSVPLSEICQPFAGSILAKNRDRNKSVKLTRIGNNEIEDAMEDDDNDSIAMSSVARAGMTKYESLNRLRSDDESEQRNARGNYVLPSRKNNPIQDFLRSLAYDPDESYKIRRDVMDTFVKSCAGYSVVTYILGVGDRHLDNLLLHESGHFFHCDFSFVLGNDPKKYLPMRITKDMINGMGGWKSDNFCQFLSLACGAFLTLRRPENVRHLLSLIRLLEGCGLPDLEKTQSMENAIQGVRDRLKLNLTDEEAILFMEKLIEDSCASKMWIAVDAIHSLAQRF